MEDQANIAALYAALAAAQAEFLPIAKNRKVVIKGDRSSYEFRYADLEAINAATRPALSKHGLAVFQTIDNGRLSCVLSHSSGGTISSSVPIQDASAKSDPKQFGGLITYMRRYLVAAILCVAADDDLDENGQPTDEGDQRPPTGQKPAVTTPQRRSEQAQQGDNGASPPATAGEIAYITKKLEAAGLSPAQARQNAGIAAGDTLDGLTKAEFTALKGVL